MDGLGTFIYNSSEGTIFGRRRRAWCEIILFYICYYVVLCAFFYAMVCFFSMFVDPFVPSLVGDKTFLKSPGLSFRPQVSFSSKDIYSDGNSKGSTNKALAKQLESILEEFKDTEARRFRRDDCTDSKPAGSRACNILDVNANFSVCNSQSAYGYDSGQQKCVAIRLNKIYGWVPDVYESVTEVQQAARRVTDASVMFVVKGKMISIFCQGKTEDDRKNLGPDIVYHPMQGFPFFAYPYKNQQRYVQPVVFVQFNILKANARIDIECYALAKNIAIDKEKKTGFIEFSLYFDKAGGGK